jgi:hypothetical protein
MYIIPAFTPTNSIGLLLFQRKSSESHPLFDETKIFAKVNYREDVINIRLFIFYSKIKPFIVTFSISIVLQKQDIMIWILYIFVSAE